jgi:hypothetical protein
MMPLGRTTRPSLMIILAVLGALGCLFPRTALGTTQISDIIYLNGEKQSLDSLPLEQYYCPANLRPQFRAPNTATWRGYVATWEIDQGVLYLKAIRAWTDQGEVRLEDLFPGQKAPVAATWFTGQLNVPQGKIIKPAAPRPLYEKYLMIKVEKGRVSSQELIDQTERSHPPGP